MTALELERLDLIVIDDQKQFVPIRDKQLARTDIASEHKMIRL